MYQALSRPPPQRAWARGYVFYNWVDLGLHGFCTVPNLQYNTVHTAHVCFCLLCVQYISHFVVFLHSLADDPYVEYTAVCVCVCVCVCARTRACIFLPEHFLFLHVYSAICLCSPRFRMTLKCTVCAACVHD